MVHAGVSDAQIGGASDPGQPGLVNGGASYSVEGCRVEAMVIRGDASVTEPLPSMVKFLAVGVRIC